MRLWHYRMISFLPEAQLCGLWRDCCAIAQQWASTGYLKHPLVKPVTSCPPEEFFVYCALVRDEMHARGFKTYEYAEAKMKDNFFAILQELENDYKGIRATIDDIWKTGRWFVKPTIFDHWHTEEYFTICYYNLEEKYLCGCVPPTEWTRFLEGGREYV